jgi:hypothetical protein
MGNEWYTPAKYVEAARKVMGGIDLDPASCAVANQIVNATNYYAKQDDGLKQNWHGRVWLNPPYSAEDLVNPIRFWISKLIEEYEQGNVTQVTILVTAGSDRKWFQPLWAYPICFPDHQVVFLRPDKKPSHKIFSNCFIYIGPNEQKFVDVFQQFGTVAKRISSPRAKPANRTLWEVVV